MSRKVFVKAEKNERGLFRGTVVDAGTGEVLATSLLEYSKASAARRVMERKLQVGVHRFVASLQKVNAR